MTTLAIVLHLRQALLIANLLLTAANEFVLSTLLELVALMISNALMIVSCKLFAILIKADNHAVLVYSATRCQNASHTACTRERIHATMI